MSTGNKEYELEIILKATRHLLEGMLKRIDKRLAAEETVTGGEADDHIDLAHMILENLIEYKLILGEDNDH